MGTPKEPKHTAEPKTANHPNKTEISIKNAESQNFPLNLKLWNETKARIMRSFFLSEDFFRNFFISFKLPVKQKNLA